jgi:hypothetical protein
LRTANERFVRLTAKSTPRLEFADSQERSWFQLGIPIHARSRVSHSILNRRHKCARATALAGHADRTGMSTNSLQVLRPYKWEGTWVFDDPAVGLVREPFILGIDRMIDELVRTIPGAEKGFRLIFSSQAFPGYTAKLEWRREESGGNWYFSPTYEIEGWLCPALLKYFAAAPAQLYARAEP